MPRGLPEIGQKDERQSCNHAGNARKKKDMVRPALATLLAPPPNESKQRHRANPEQNYPQTV